MPKKVKVKDMHGTDVYYTPTKKGMRPGNDPAFIKRKMEMEQGRADFVKENAEHYKKTPQSKVDASPYADARSTNDMRPKNPANKKAREEIWRKHNSQVTPGKWKTKEK
jgi:hypothetical protein